MRDIEDLHELGQDMSICAYYGSRESVPLAQVVTMPYSMLLSKDTRESLGVELDGNVVILDEAHNIVEAVNSTYTVAVSMKQLVVARRSLWAYFKKYEKRFKGRNVFYLKQLLAVLELLTKFLRLASKKSVSASQSTDDNDDDDSESTAAMLRVNDFLFSAKVDHFNMFKLVEYLRESGLAKKLLGFLDATSAESAATEAIAPPVAGQSNAYDDDNDERFESRHVSPLRAIEAFLRALTNAGDDGRILAQPPNVRADGTGRTTAGRGGLTRAYVCRRRARASKARSSSFS